MLKIQILCVTLHLQAIGCTTFWNKKKRYAYLAIGNLRNFRFDAGDSIVVLTRIAWATIVTPAS